MKDFLTKEVLTQRIGHLVPILNDKIYLFEEYYDLYYLTGLKLSKGTLLVGSQIALFVDARYEEIAKKKCPWPVYALSEEVIKKWLQECAEKKLYFDGLKTSYDRYVFWHKLTQVLNKELIAEHSPLQAIRMIKSDQELEALEHSAHLLVKGFSYIKSLLKEGVTELQVAKAFEIFCLEQGAQKLSFEPIIAFGENSAMPHYRSGSTRLNLPTVVLIDIGVTLNDYASDMTRTLLLGEVDPKLFEIYNVVKDTHDRVLQHVKPGVSIRFLDEFARNCIQNYPILHALGHGIGLEVHEYPRISIQSLEDTILQKNMVITIEPGIYIPGLGGVRYEDTVVLQENGFKNFYNKL
ncbi:MAG: Xaa-Pro peptidase family protein [Chlamydiota bacterium]